MRRTRGGKERERTDVKTWQRSKRVGGRNHKKLTLKGRGGG